LRLILLRSRAEEPIALASRQPKTKARSKLSGSFDMPTDRPMAEAKIEVNLSRLAQLFNSLDPSPFHERDLDQDAEDYIIGSAEEISHQRPLSLVIHLPADQLPQTGPPISVRLFIITLLIAKRTNGGGSAFCSAMVESPWSVA